PWTFAQDLGHVDAVTLIQSNFGGGNLELIARVGDRLHFLWRDSGPAFQWNGPYQIAAGAAGNPVLIQSRFGTNGNFELVYPAAGGGLTFMWRNNDAAGLPWSAPWTFAQDLGHVDAVTLIQSNFGGGNLELIARVDDDLYFFWRDSGPEFRWNGPFRMNLNGLPNGQTPEIQQMIDQITQARRNEGNCAEPGVRVDSRLSEVARKHSEDLAANYATLIDAYPQGDPRRGHIDSDGLMPADRIRAAGFSPASKTENWSFGTNQTLAQAMDNWLYHDEASNWGHRQALLNCDYRIIGVGTARGHNNRIYWTVDFARG
ncbi:CAP domain-containing protein, partial [Microbispora sp. NPDC046973]|uniref:CAP domain-containing protein n=1 Tax=Microbispora sp. NPDC046973 TaxID=3155022 RepID=UPI0034045710